MSCADSLVEEAADRLGALGRVLGDVAGTRDRLAALEHTDVDLPAPADRRRLDLWLGAAGPLAGTGDRRGRVSRRGANRIAEKLGGELRRRRLDQVATVVRRRGVEPDHDVEVQRPARLVLGHLDV